MHGQMQCQACSTAGYRHTAPPHTPGKTDCSVQWQLPEAGLQSQSSGCGLTNDNRGPAASPMRRRQLLTRFQVNAQAAHEHSCQLRPARQTETKETPQVLRQTCARHATGRCCACHVAQGSQVEHQEVQHGMRQCCGAGPDNQRLAGGHSAGADAPRSNQQTHKKGPPRLRAVSCALPQAR